MPGSSEWAASLAARRRLGGADPGTFSSPYQSRSQQPSPSLSLSLSLNVPLYVTSNANARTSITSFI